MRLFVVSGFPMPEKPSLNQIQAVFEIEESQITKRWVSEEVLAAGFAGCGIYSLEQKAYLEISRLYKGEISWSNPALEESRGSIK